MEKQERAMRPRRRFHQAAAAAIAATLCSHGVHGSLMTTNVHKLRGMESLQQESQAIDVDMCDGRPRNHSLTWTRHDEDWHRQCHLHWQEADSQSPFGQWTQTEFTDFVKRQIHTSFTDFRQLPLPLTMIFNELSCRCEGSDCCHGSSAKIEADGDGWMDSICNRVDNALDEVCRRQQRQSRANEL